MTDTLRAMSCAGLVCALMMTAACSSPAPDPAAADIAKVTQAASAQLNSPIAAMQKRLKSANSDAMIDTEELRLAGSGESVPFDWWAYGKGFLTLGGVYQTTAFFKLTPAGEAFVAAPTASWLQAKFSGAPQLACSGDSHFSLCKVTGTLAVTPTAAGAAELKTKTIAAQPVDADLTYGPQGWTVTELRGGDKLAATGTEAILGSPQQVYAARNLYAAKVNKLVR